MKSFRKTVALLVSAFMLASVSGCSGAATATVEIKAETKEEVKKLVDQFYDGLAEADPVEMTSMLNGEITNVFTRSGGKIKNDDKMNNIVFYMFEENGKKYYLGEDGNPSEEEYTYDFYDKTIEMSLGLMVTAYFQDDVSEADGLKYSAVQKETTVDGKKETELQISITAEENGATAEVKSTGFKTDGKVTKLVCTIAGNDQKQDFEYDFKYDGVEVELPEYTIYDRSQFCHHVDSPYETFQQAQDAAWEDGLPYLSMGNKVYVITEKDGKYYQLSAELEGDTAAAYEGLDVQADDYSEQVNALLNPLAITDCVDFSELVLSAEDIENYKGKTLSVLMGEGFEPDGWMFSDEESAVYMSKNDIIYEIDITVPEGFDPDSDFEFEDLGDSVINNMTFNDVNGSAFPIE